MELGMEEVKKVIEEIKRRTTAPACSLVVDRDRRPELCDSKFGGFPYWDPQKEYPKDAEGTALILLAQLNFDRMQAVQPLPDKGMLQFFIRPDDMFGIDFDHPDKQNTFRVVYHETVNYDVTREELEALGVPDSSREEYADCTPVQSELAVNCVSKDSAMSFGDYRFEHMFREAVKDLFGTNMGEASVYDVVDYEVMDEIEEEQQELDETENGHWMLGYPYFTQTDPREYQEQYRRYNTMLFQMDSQNDDTGKGWDYLVIWGDCGVGNFFINREDLENRDFSKVLYNWDCC